MGHILDTAIRCFRAIRVQLPNKGKFAKLKPNLEKYLHHHMEHLRHLEFSQLNGFNGFE